MKPKTEEFLNFLLWSAELLTRPSFRNVTESYEAWAYRKGLLRQASSLREAGLLERATARAEDRLFRLTEAGRLHALGGRDPAIQWARAWDRRWRFIMFDVPEKRNSQRDRLRRFLRSRSFGCLQGSVWISPDSLGEIRQHLEGDLVNVNSLNLLEGTPQGGESDSQIVEGAWNFQEINRRYSEHIKVLGECPSEDVRDNTSAKSLQRWAAVEREAWLEAVCKDPLLPEPLLPDGYLGKQAWRKRVQVLARASEQLRKFAP